MQRFKWFVSRNRLLLAVVVVWLLVGATFVLAEKTERGYLGVSIERLSTGDREEFGVSYGVLVVGVSKEQAAEKAGIKKYDVIQTFNGEKIRRPDDLIEAVRESKPGTKAAIGLVRDKKNMEVQAVVGELKEHEIIISKKGSKEPRVFRWSSRGYLGIYLQYLNPDLASYFAVKENEGALILEVEKGSPAEKAGLKAGDVIVKIDKEKIGDAKDVRQALSDIKDGQSIEVTVVRHGKQLVVKAEPGDRFKSRKLRIIGESGELDLLEIPEIDIDLPELPEIPVVIHEDVLRDVRNALKRVKIHLRNHWDEINFCIRDEIKQELEHYSI